ncbi:class I SAM-dependent methyltransferase [uncultured Acetobacterium sp.]|uniref:class I SAM-dependent methyltransferase n=1 Tax=uncultured Acetobacterium sp. TaxID=217139 RepID=UPI0025E20040|nr:class I SAM-dependent methyltransferase [uncultured Acetobacterium sp.]
MNFEEKWIDSKKKTDLNESKQFWDDRASEFNEIGKREMVDDPVLLLLKSKGAIFPGARVLDIGCGAGRYSKEFLRIGCEVVGIDISPNMIDFTKENTASLNVDHFTFKVLPWETADLAAEGWEGYFDLVFASMSPAISGPEELRKMNQASKGYCFMSGHLIKEDKIGNELRVALHKENRAADYRNTLYYAFNILWDMGYFAEFRHSENQRESVWELEKAANYYTHMLRATDEQTKQAIREYLKKKSEAGQIKDVNYSKSGQLLWSVQADQINGR